jgi:hypothetical protein
MGYYILYPNPTIEVHPEVLDCPEEFDPVELIEGKLLEPPASQLHLKLSPRSGDYRGCMIDGIVTLFHDIFRDELNRLGVDNIQYFPAELEDSEGEIEVGYSLINIIGLVDAADRSKSKMKLGNDGRINQLYSFSVDPKKAKGLRLFRIVGAQNLIIINQTLAEELDSFEPPGIWMISTEEYNGWGF